MEILVYSKAFFKLTFKKSANAYTPFPPFIFVNMTNTEKKYLHSESLKSHIKTLNHERIHHEQMKELCLFMFYWYYFKYTLKLWGETGKFKSYKDNPFEREAYFNSHNEVYIQNRKKNAWKSYIY